MFAQRVGVSALRRAATKPTSALFSPSVTRALIVRSAMALQTRPITTQKISQTQANDILANQRLHRPVSPHITIYDRAQIWYGVSIMQRFTGMFFAGSLYAGTLAYLAAPLVGWHLESASLVSLVAGLPFVVKSGLKLAVAWPFTFHLFNGIRHLFWDATIGFTRAEIAKGTQVIWASSVLAALGLVFLL